MKKEILNKLLAGAVLCSPLAGFGAGNNLYSGADGHGNGIPLETQLRIDIDKDTDVVKIDRDDTTEFLVTKAFVLKHADPYELRPYVQKMVNGAELSGNEGRVECAKYDDGTGILIVTAEEKKFTDGINGGLSVEQLIKKLDQPGVTSSSGQKKFVYFAKHESAHDLYNMLDQVYLQATGTGATGTAELDNVKEKIAVDDELNALLVYCNPYNVDKAQAALASIDKQGSNNHFKVSVYEIEKHNTADLGHDFQAWKNANHNMFSFQDTTSLVVSGGIDSQYIDFLETRGMAKVFTQAEMVLANGKHGKLSVADATVRDIEEGATKIANDEDSVADDITAGTTNNTVKQAADREARMNADALTFDLLLEPVKVGSTTMLNVDISNKSYMGFEKNGTLKTHTLTFDTEIVMDTKNAGRYVIGGLEKKELVEVVNKVPVLGSIPLLGWIFTTEENQTKSTELVVVVESAKVKSNWGLTEDTTDAKFSIEEATEKAGESIEFGTDQYLLDNDKNFMNDMNDIGAEIQKDVQSFIGGFTK